MSKMAQKNVLIYGFLLPYYVATSWQRNHPKNTTTESSRH